MGWTLVEPPFAAQLVFEMLDRVGHKEFAAPNAGFAQLAVEHRSSGTDKRLAGKVFAVSRLLADRHQCRARRAVAWHDLRRVAIKIAAPARSFFMPEPGQCGDRRGKQIVQYAAPLGFRPDSSGRTQLP